MSCEQLKLENQVCFRFYTVARLIVQGYQPWLSVMGITYTQYLVLMVLWEQDGQPVNDIAKRLFLETNTVTPLVKRLEESGIVRRVKDKRDARKTHVRLTKQGRELEAQAADVPGCMTQMLTDNGLTPELFMKIVPPLDEIIANLSH
ncbi:MAG: MarR family transcriptional regulator [Bacteroidales bacterium]|nr:MarR family transcriptional regulator [Bacteroidales bacterium]